MSARVLLVDDDEDALDLLQLGLSRRGYEVEVADSLASGRARLARGAFDALVTDVNLPDGSGLDLLDGVPRPRLALALSGMCSSEDRDEVLRRGFDGLVGKPATLDALDEALRRVAS